jgi:P27 family predicted phage terminase small subunit
MGKFVQQSVRKRDSHSAGPKPAPAVETPLRGRPPRPKGLNKEAQEHFDSIVSMMDQSGMLSMLDTDILYIYIDAWSRYRLARHRGQAEGWVVSTPYGPRKNPWYEIMMQAASVIRNCADRMGLTPAARTKLRVETADLDPSGKWAAFGVIGRGG